jgi:hypothetical protein
MGMRLKYVMYGLFLPFLGSAYYLLLGAHASIDKYIMLFAMGYFIAVADDIALIADDVKKRSRAQPVPKVRGDRDTQKIGSPLNKEDLIVSEPRHLRRFRV